MAEGTIVSEQGMRSKILQILRPLHGVAVENRVGPGTPDVNYREGWIELKWLRGWPKQATSVVPLDHFTTQQRLWLARRSRARGKAWLLVQCRREWLLFRGDRLPSNVGVTRQELLALAERYWPRGLVEKEFLECLGTLWS